MDEVPAQLFIVVFEGVHDYIAILPPAVWVNSTGTLHGVLPLIAGVRPHFHPFMVHNSKVFQAVLSLFEAARTQQQCYQVPTTGALLRGFQPQLTRAPEISPRDSDSQRFRTSYDVVTDLWKKIKNENLGEVSYNPVTPLVCDFLLKLPTFTELLRIEYKSNPGNVLEIHLEQGPRSPFTRNRQWHFLIIQNTSPDHPEWICIGRHQVNEHWADKMYLYLDVDSFPVYKGTTGLRRMLLDIAQAAPQATQKTKQLLLSGVPEELPLATLIKSNGAENMDESKECEEIDDEIEAALKTDWRYAKELPRLCDHLNHLCCKNRALVRMPLDVGHPLGNHVMVEYSWTDEDMERYKTNGTLPAVTYSQDLLEKDCILLRFQDMSNKRKADTPYPL